MRPVDLPSANGFGKPFAASKFEKSNIEEMTVDTYIYVKNQRSFLYTFPKKRSQEMANQRTLEQFRAENEKVA